MLFYVSGLNELSAVLSKIVISTALNAMALFCISICIFKLFETKLC